MKTTVITILFFLFTVLTSKSFAQGNLQFNQVLTYSGSVYQGGTGPTWTVPAGKVWKVENFTYSFFVLNNDRADNTSSNNGPLWLKAGDQIRYDLAFYGANCCGASTTYRVSIIEFNIVP